jgi:hypothetical protein
VIPATSRLLAHVKDTSGTVEAAIDVFIEMARMVTTTAEGRFAANLQGNLYA